MDYENDMRLEHYIEIGAISLEGMDENGEMIFAINEIAKEIAPELWQAHISYVDESLLELYKAGLLEVEYNENLEAIFNVSPEGQRIAKEMGIMPIELPEPPNY